MEVIERMERLGEKEGRGWMWMIGLGCRLEERNRSERWRKYWRSDEERERWIDGSGNGSRNGSRKWRSNGSRS
ncbi:hypothetical protein ACRFB9_28250, partial [Klebsiella pneumoniae]